MYRYVVELTSVFVRFLRHFDLSNNELPFFVKETFQVVIKKDVKAMLRLLYCNYNDVLCIVLIYLTKITGKTTETNAESNL